MSNFPLNAKNLTAKAQRREDRKENKELHLFATHLFGVWQMTGTTKAKLMIFFGNLCVLCGEELRFSS
ncbi:hypothetical protein [Propionivibrio sp.]|uniref:hypothetical protein n=1 Tax=Propionivibrio sp. TaxID=2212460 RepID=UPI003BF00057